jgi:HSP20 family protein
MEHRPWLPSLDRDFLNAVRPFSFFPGGVGEFFINPGLGPSVDLKETDNEFVINADIPGVNPTDLDITVHDRSVTIKGEVRHAEEKDEEGYHLSERRHGSFFRTIPLPEEVVSDKAVATYGDGVLRLRVPKVETSARKGYKPKIETNPNQH